MKMANRKHQGRPVSEATIQSVYRDRLLWGLEELRQVTLMVQDIVQDIADEAEQYGDDRTKEVACYLYGLCNNVLDYGDSYKRALEGRW